METLAVPELWIGGKGATVRIACGCVGRLTFTTILPGKHRIWYAVERLDVIEGKGQLHSDGETWAAWSLVSTFRSKRKMGGTVLCRRWRAGFDFLGVPSVGGSGFNTSARVCLLSNFFLQLANSSLNSVLSFSLSITRSCSSVIFFW